MSDLLPVFFPWVVGLLMGLPLGMAIRNDNPDKK